VPTVQAPTLRFGGETPAEIDRLLRDAAAAYADTPRAEALLSEALALDPDCLAVHFARYKFCFYKSKSRLADAEHATREALATAARLAGFSANWSQLGSGSANWSDVSDPAHFYLFSLKALAFIRLRRGAGDEAQAILAKLAELDPRDSVGATVIGSLAAGAQAGAPGRCIEAAGDASATESG
jgi:tetratricopeptide (TPR) repeat protein